LHSFSLLWSFASLIPLKDFGGNSENKVVAYLKSHSVPKGVQDDGYYDHYTILRTIEGNWELGNLGRKDVQGTKRGFEILYPPPVAPLPHYPQPQTQPQPQPSTPPRDRFDGKPLETSYFIEYVTGSIIVVIIVGAVLLVRGTERGRQGFAALVVRVKSTFWPESLSQQVQTAKDSDSEEVLDVSSSSGDEESWN
jgi:hypothetical protein